MQARLIVADGCMKRTLTTPPKLAATRPHSHIGNVVAFLQGQGISNMAQRVSRNVMPLSNNNAKSVLYFSNEEIY